MATRRTPKPTKKKAKKAASRKKATAKKARKPLAKRSRAPRPDLLRDDTFSPMANDLPGGIDEPTGD